MNTVKIETRGVKMVAHRGVSGLERENTNLAFVAAGNRSYFGIETDIHCTADGNFVLHHDDSTLRLTGVDRVIEETDFATLRAMRLSDLDGSFGREDLVMPTLEEYIGICKKYEKVAVLELKRHMEEERVRAIIDRIEAMEYLDKVVFISFDFENLVYVRNYRPAQAVQFLFSKLSDEIVEKMLPATCMPSPESPEKRTTIWSSFCVCPFSAIIYGLYGLLYVYVIPHGGHLCAKFRKHL